jgi:hypothetical protein
MSNITDEDLEKMYTHITPNSNEYKTARNYLLETTSGQKNSRRNVIRVLHEMKSKQQNTTPIETKNKHAYLVIGHGSELMGHNTEKNTKIPDKLKGRGMTVPDDIIVVTLAVCGDSTYEKDVCPYLHGFTDLSNETMFKDPINYQKELETKFGVPLHIYTPGMNMPYFIVQYYALMENSLYKSGVYEFPIANNLKISDELQRKSDVCPEFEVKDIDHSQPVNEDIYNEIFAGSLYPNHAQIFKNQVQISSVNGNTRTRPYTDLKGPFTFPFEEVLDTLKKPAVYYYLICRAPFVHKKGTYEYGQLPKLGYYTGLSYFTLPEPISTQRYIDKFAFKKYIRDKDHEGYNELVDFIHDPKSRETHRELYNFLKSLYINPHEKNEVKRHEKVLEKMNLLLQVKVNLDQLVPLHRNNENKIIKDQNYKLRDGLDLLIGEIENDELTNQYTSSLHRIGARRALSNQHQYEQIGFHQPQTAFNMPVYENNANNHQQSAFNMPTPFGKGGKRTRRTKRKKSKTRKHK